MAVHGRGQSNSVLITCDVQLRLLAGSTLPAVPGTSGTFRVGLESLLGKDFSTNIDKSFAVALKKSLYGLANQRLIIVDDESQNFRISKNSSKKVSRT